VTVEALAATVVNAGALESMDLDGDGRLDSILAGRKTRNTVWHRNQKANRTNVAAEQLQKWRRRNFLTTAIRSSS
jgi:hypothetical protein